MGPGHRRERGQAGLSLPYSTPDGGLPRLVRLAGCSNLRDLGGYRGADGRTVRFGRAFRSASLASLTDGDLAVVGRLGLRTICDLRGAHERQHAVSRLPNPAPEVVTLPIEPTVGASLRDIQARGEATGEDVLSLLTQAYTAYATTKMPQYRALLELAAAPDRLPLLFHCSAGKDRTGFGAALLLTALGVSRQDVMEDYLATNRFWRGEHSLPPGIPDVVAQTLQRAHASLLDTALDTVMHAHRDTDAFLDASLGLDPARLAALRDILLE